MSIILSIDTSTFVCSVSLHVDEKLLVSQELFFEHSHSGSLLSLINNTFDYSGYTVKDLSAIAITKGPGSYTGLRIGTATAKGLCFSLDIPLISINTLEAMAFGMNNYNVDNCLLCPMLDARRMEVYCMVLDENLKVVKDTEAHIITEESFYDFLEINKVIFFGNGSDKAKNLIGKHKNARFISGIDPLAIHVGALAIKKYLKKEFEDLAYFEPFYLKDFVGGRINS